MITQQWLLFLIKCIVPLSFGKSLITNKSHGHGTAHENLKMQRVPADPGGTLRAPSSQLTDCFTETYGAGSRVNFNTWNSGNRLKQKDGYPWPMAWDAYQQALCRKIENHRHHWKRTGHTWQFLGAASGHWVLRGQCSWDLALLVLDLQIYPSTPAGRAATPLQGAGNGDRNV